MLFLSAQEVFGDSIPEIYLIRHAPVKINKPDWCTSKIAARYKSKYDEMPIKDFEPEEVLSKIANPESIDTVFTSPQSRALHTAIELFDEDVVYKVNTNLRELDYPVIRLPWIKLPVNGWLVFSRIAWMMGINEGDNASYKCRVYQLEKYSNELIAYAENHGKTVVVAHGFVNNKLISILKKKGWKLTHNEGYGNLSVNKLKRREESK